MKIKICRLDKRRTDNTKLYGPLVAWPGVAEDAQAGVLTEPGGALVIARDGKALYDSLVAPVSCSDPASQRSIKLLSPSRR